MFKLLVYVQIAIAIAVSLFFLLVGFGLFWLTVVPEDFETAFVFVVGVVFMLSGAYGILFPTRVKVRTTMNDRRHPGHDGRHR